MIRLHAGVFYSARSQVSAEYWKHFTAHFDDVHAFGYNSAENGRICMKSVGVYRVTRDCRGWLWQIFGAICAVATARESGEAMKTVGTEF